MEAFKNKIILSYGNGVFGYRVVEHSINELYLLVGSLGKTGHNGYVIADTLEGVSEDLISPTLQQALSGIWLKTSKLLSNASELYLLLYDGKELKDSLALSEYLIDETAGFPIGSKIVKSKLGYTVSTLGKVDFASKGDLLSDLNMIESVDLVSSPYQDDIKYLQERLSAKKSTSNVPPSKRKTLGYLTNRGDLFYDKEVLTNKEELDSMVYALDSAKIPYQYTKDGDFVLNPNGRVLLGTLQKEVSFLKGSPVDAVSKLQLYLKLAYELVMQHPLKLTWNDELLQLLYYSIKLDYVPKVKDRSSSYFVREYLYFGEDIRNICNHLNETGELRSYFDLLIVLYISHLINGDMVVDLVGEVSRLEYAKGFSIVRGE